ncbi:MAG: DUF2520 domain-containing protein [Candidatus Marinimicrobia bacterium]|nr:DUF2520 domain-containing protein [Candidatus Neomarinimicrobiota bacterium]
MNKLALIGLGRVGVPLLAALRKAEYAVDTFTRQQTEMGEHRDLSAYDLAFLTVPDQELPSLVSGVEHMPRTGVVHTSGQVRNANLGQHVSMFHPVMSFRGGESAAIFTGCPIGISARDEALLLLFSVAGRMGARPFEVDETRKETYHLAVMFASVFPYILLLTARELAAECGIPAHQAAAVLGPIFGQAERHLAASSPSGGLTGPVSRGDSATIERHMHVLEAHPQLRKLYRQLTELSIGYAHQPPEIARKLAEALT